MLSLLLAPHYLTLHVDLTLRGKIWQSKTSLTTLYFQEKNHLNITNWLTLNFLWHIILILFMFLGWNCILLHVHIFPNPHFSFVILSLLHIYISILILFTDPGFKSRLWEVIQPCCLAAAETHVNAITETLAVTKVESSCLPKADVYKSTGSRVSGNIRLEKFFPNKV